MGRCRWHEWENHQPLCGSHGDNTIASGMGYDTGNISQLPPSRMRLLIPIRCIRCSTRIVIMSGRMIKKMYRVLFPQTADAPLIYHIISSDDATVKKGIDQAHNAGFNMVLLCFELGAILRRYFRIQYTNINRSAIMPTRKECCLARM